MLNTILTSAALMAASALAQGVGSAIVVNGCNYPIYVTAVPASGGGQSQIGPNQLAQGQSFSQPYTSLTNGDGWSIKLSMDASLSSIMQYEYTYHNDGIIWFDLSDVNGNPWGQDWSISATGDCTPKETAYQYSTDDAYGMQSCPAASAVTVTLCGSGSGSAPAASPAESPASSPSPSPSPVSEPSPVVSVPSVASVPTSYPFEKAAENVSTLATSVRSTVTNLHTVVVTEYVTASPVPAKRAQHFHRHADHHRL